jgi:hypothetical protein
MSFINLFFFLVVCPAAFWEIHLGEGRYKHPLHRTAILAFPFSTFFIITLQSPARTHLFFLVYSIFAFAWP